MTDHRTFVFIDRDGTMGGPYYVKYPTDYYPYEGTPEAFRLLKDNGYPAVIITNQSCIARGLDGGYDFAAEFRAIGAYDWFICPHDAQDHCRCRKPEPGLFEQAEAKYGMDLSRCYMIGDRWSDMAAAGQMGIRLILVMTGRGEEALGIDRDQWRDYEPVYVAADLLDAVRFILARGETPPQGIDGCIVENPMEV